MVRRVTIEEFFFEKHDVSSEYAAQLSQFDALFGKAPIRKYSKKFPNMVPELWASENPRLAKSVRFMRSFLIRDSLPAAIHHKFLWSVYAIQTPDTAKFSEDLKNHLVTLKCCLFMIAFHFEKASEQEKAFVVQAGMDDWLARGESDPDFCKWLESDDCTHFVCGNLDKLPA